GEAREREAIAAEGSRAIGPAVGEPWPVLRDEALHGLAGDVVRTIDPHTEADPAAVLAHFLVMFGNAVGPTPHVRVGADLHRANLFAVAVGSTSRGRKGTSEGQARRLLSGADAEWAKSQIVHGLSTGEGLISTVRDEVPAGPGQAAVPAPDRRLLVIEPEFASTLRVMRRDGNSLSGIIRQAWDSGDLRVMTRKDPIRSTGSHISIIGHVTGTELVRHMDSTETDNGFANRFLWLKVKRSKELPDGGQLTDRDLFPLSERTAAALDSSRRGVPERRRSPEAAQLWREAYKTLSAEHPGLFGAVTSRAEAQVTRLSLVYALLDSSREIEVEHLKAALASWDYASTSASLIFGDLLGDPIADRILKELRASDGLARTDISALFGRNISAAAIERALLTLADLKLARSERVATSGRGRPAERWLAL
ncbi:MAG: DUF3987 domain-containing protein, partial [Thermoanaerobaculia bacterium]